jgi:hypothetical protein
MLLHIFTLPLLKLHYTATQSVEKAIMYNVFNHRTDHYTKQAASIFPAGPGRSSHDLRNSAAASSTAPTPKNTTETAGPHTTKVTETSLEERDDPSFGTVFCR